MQEELDSQIRAIKYCVEERAVLEDVLRQKTHIFVDEKQYFYGILQFMQRLSTFFFFFSLKHFSPQVQVAGYSSVFPKLSFKHLPELFQLNDPSLLQRGMVSFRSCLVLINFVFQSLMFISPLICKCVISFVALGS